jgi:type VI secretion system secreted protein Hcp
MAVDMFIKIGDAGGESADHKHKGEIDVLSWQWGMSQSGTGHIGGGSGSGKVSVQDLTFTKYIDKSSPKLMLSCCNGKHFPEALLTVRKAGEKPIEYVKIKLTEVLVSSISTGGSGGEDRLTETITLNFSQVAVDYTSQKADGSPDSPVTMKWNVSSNTNA